MIRRRGRDPGSARPAHWLRLPAARAGMRIGLFGGSFDPPHAGHAAIARAALVRLRLDAVWLIVSPGNPLKADTPHSHDERAHALRRLLLQRRFVISDVEAQAGLHFTVDTVAVLQARCPGVRFIWIAGADSFAGLHRWRGWRTLMHAVPFAVFDRPSGRLAALAGPAVHAFTRARHTGSTTGLIGRSAPAWAYISIPQRHESSSALRQHVKSYSGL